MPRGGRGKTTCPFCKTENIKVHRGRCAQCTVHLAVALNEQVRSKQTAQRLKKYGITPELYAQLFAEQKGVCAICCDPQRSKKDGPRSGLVVDHNHQTGEVRGLLCWSCNLGIGFLGDNPEWLKNGGDYVKPKRVERQRAKLSKAEARLERLGREGEVPQFQRARVKRLREQVALREEIRERTRNA